MASLSATMGFEHGDADEYYLPNPKSPSLLYSLSVFFCMRVWYTI